MHYFFKPTEQGSSKLHKRWITKFFNYQPAATVSFPIDGIALNEKIIAKEDQLEP